eukprot:Awhi_evm1s2135
MSKAVSCEFVKEPIKSLHSQLTLQHNSHSSSHDFNKVGFSENGQYIFSQALHSGNCEIWNTPKVDGHRHDDDDDDDNDGDGGDSNNNFDEDDRET